MWVGIMKTSFVSWFAAGAAGEKEKGDHIPTSASWKCNSNEMKKRK